MIKIFCAITFICLIIGVTMAQDKKQSSELNLSISEQLAFSTVRIEVEYKNGRGVGTGFFFRFEIDEKNIPVLVTNRHVIDGGVFGSFMLTTANSDGGPNLNSHIPVRLNDFEKRWIIHPDSNIDLAIMPVAPLINQASQSNHSIFYRTLDKNIIPSTQQLEDLTAVEEILMIGYPIGIWDKVNNYPIFRSGITATHPANDYNGKDEFLIDAACFPGSSGSPILLANFGNYVTKKGDTVIGSRLYFLGILYAGPQYTTTGEIKIVNVPTKQDTIAVTKIPTNLGIIIKSERILDFKNIIKDMLLNQ